MQGFLLLLALLTAQGQGADLSHVMIAASGPAATVAWEAPACGTDTCEVTVRRTGTHVITDVYNGAEFGTNRTMLGTVRRMARLLGDYTGFSRHRVGYTNGHAMVEEWKATYTGGNCTAKVCRVLVFRYRLYVGGSWHWGSEVG